MKPYRKLSILFIAAAALFSVIPVSSAEKKKDFPIDTTAPCISADCHAGMGRKKYLHSIGVDPGKCNRCHEIAAEGKHTFNPIPEKTVQLCSECHSEDRSKPSDIKGNPPKVIAAGEDVTLHTPFAEGKCTICHDAHESDYYRHLKVEYPAEPYASYSAETYKLCSNAECHKELDKTLTEPRTLISTMFRNGNVNLHYKHVNKKKGRTCRTCHQQHGSKNPSLITDAFKFGSRTLTNEYEKTESGGSCNTTCHREAKYDRYEPAFNSIRTSPTPGEEATVEELKLSRERDVQEGKIKTDSKNN